MPSSQKPDGLPQYSDVTAAAERLSGHARVTPLLQSNLLNERLGGRLLVKPEMLQRTGSFKFRGAFNRVSRIHKNVRGAGVVAYSSGNHAQGVAAAARLLGMPALIVMPRDAPEIKIASTRAHGAEIVFYDRLTENREEIGECLAADRGATLVRPYDDPYVIAGQGTVGLELAAQAREAGVRLDAVLLPCGGGGLTAGSALALAEECPETELYGVEPAGFDDTARSLAAGERRTNDARARSICDALQMPSPGEMTFAINVRLLTGGLVVDDDAAAAAMATAFSHFKVVAEPSGAVALAAMLEGIFPIKGKTVAVVCSGGNVDAQAFRAALDRPG
ncbi:MAG: threonine/serine dehydratase [Rhodospirillales bacterium]|jgi:threonine dehydratase|nr:threonine/serine dehydratase [Rhodospirillales bacterium]MDP6883010.1 threonine/serine dehydratase [Rhodospirillales bacterium]